ncbi:hypothetical protein [Streptomyces sp. NPDC058595]|uniref:hypothetical protein n=1 Tax=Streptomyces sp. NPDC058595 TaxID=3346550 RepID=UPI0036679BF1
MAGEPVQISVDQLRRALDVALRHIEASAGPTVTLKEDLFWSVSAEELYDAYRRLDLAWEAWPMTEDRTMADERDRQPH